MLYTLRYQNKFSSRRDEHAFQHELSRRLLDYSLRAEYAVALSELRLVRLPHGKPVFENFPVHFSIAHCGGLVCCALSQSEIGIDCEKIRPFNARLAERICTAAELEGILKSDNKAVALTALWTLKESLMKLSGEGMAYGFKNAEFAAESGGVRPVAVNAKAACFTASDYIISVCALGELPAAPVAAEFFDLP